jgi:hypothetical protein
LLYGELAINDGHHNDEDVAVEDALGTKVLCG